MLAVSGELDRTIGGESKPLTATSVAERSMRRPADSSRMKRCRCSICPPRSVTCEQRVVTNVPLQKLFFLNSDTVEQTSGGVCEAHRRPKLRMKASTAAYQTSVPSAADSDRNGSWAASFLRR